MSGFDSVVRVERILGTLGRLELDEVSGIGIDVSDVPISEEFWIIVRGRTSGGTRIEFDRFLIN